MRSLLNDAGQLLLVVTPDFDSGGRWFDSNSRKFEFSNCSDSWNCNLLKRRKSSGWMRSQFRKLVAAIVACEFESHDFRLQFASVNRVLVHVIAAIFPACPHSAKIKQIGLTGLCFMTASVDMCKHEAECWATQLPVANATFAWLSSAPDACGRLGANV